MVSGPASDATPAADLAGWSPVPRPTHRPLHGARVHLEPFDPAIHAEELFAAAQGPRADPHLWRYLPYGPFTDVAELRAWLAERSASIDPLFLTVVDTMTGRAGGVVSFLRVEPSHRCIEIGHIWFGAALQRTPQATETIYLLARHAFDDLGNRRMEWKCDAANAHSCAAAERFGFTFEGVFRQDKVIKGRNRDTAWFSLLDREWPAARAAFEAWLAPENFDADGRQRRPLAALHRRDGEAVPLPRQAHCGRTSQVPRTALVVNGPSEKDVDARAPLARAQGQFQAEGVYLDTASLGLPPRAALEALHGVLEDWRLGRASPPDYDAPLSASRRAYAQLVGVDPASVAVGSQVSVFAGLVAAGLPDGSEVLTVHGEFTSIVFPFLAQGGRGVRVREAPLERLADAVTPDTKLVAVSAVQSANGRVADLDALTEVCAATDTPVLLDTTQAVGWLPVDAGRFAYTVCGGYKWLLAPRGTAFFTVQPDLADGLVPHAAGWYAGDDPWTSIYGSPLRLAAGVRRFDVSPAWHSWVGQAPALELLAGVGAPALHDHAVGLASRFLAALGLPPGNSAIVSLASDEQAARRLAEAHVTTSVRSGRLRLSFHVNNTDDDADRAADVLRGHVSNAGEPSAG